MILRISATLVFGLALAATSWAQPVVRFDTSVGDFDMVLNPTNSPFLQGHVDNLLAYVNDRRYHCTVINRAAENFVLQMGGFLSDTLVVPDTVDGFESVETFAPILGAPAAQLGFTNSRGTVAMALPGLPGGGTNQNGGTSSYFVNLGDNSFLDPDFTVFAVIPDLTTIDRIMALDQVDLTQDPNSGAAPGNLAFSDIPLQDDGNMVFIERAFVIDDTIASTFARNAALAQLIDPSLVTPQPLAALNSAAGTAPLQAASSANSSSTTSPLASNLTVVPEPSALLLAAIAWIGVLALRRQR